MHVLMLNYEFPPLGGGAGNATYCISSELVKKGCQVDVLTSISNGYSVVENLDNVRVYRVRSWRKDIFDCGVLGAWSYLFFARIQLAKLMKDNKYDIVHIFFSLPTGALTLMDKRLKKLPYIVSLRGSDVQGYDKYNYKLEFLHKILKLLNNSILRNASRIVALSNGLRKKAIQACSDCSIDIIYNGVDRSLFKPCKKEKTGIVKLIAVSRLLERKGIQHLLKALAGLDQVKYQLKIVGTGNYEQVLKEMTTKLNLNDKVKFCGYTPRNDLPELYSSSDIFVLPSLTESFGQVFTEAMACGLPIIGSNVGGIPEIVEHNKNGILIEPGDVESLRNALLRLMEDDELRKVMAERNPQKVEELFSWERVSQQYYDIYRSVVE